MAAPSARQYPWAALDKVTRADAAAARALRRWAAGLAGARSAGEALSALLGARVRVEVRRARAIDGARALRVEDGAVAAIVAPLDAPELARGALVEAEATLAAALAARAIRRPAPAIAAPGSNAGNALAGAFAAIVAAAARRARADQPMRVIAAGPAPALARDLASACGALFEATLSVAIEDEAFAARVLVPRAIAEGAEEAPWTRDALAAMGDVPLAIPIVACATTATATDVGSLRRGDAWLPGAWPLKKTDAGALAGPVLLAPPAAEVALLADLGEDGRLVLRGEIEPLAWADAEGDVSEEKGALVEAVGEVPVVVRVEVGVAEMRARDWANVARGDVIALGRRVGDPVTLRVGGVAVARGELVDLEGEVGVRIVGRMEER